jgi:hypothetical protein
MQYHIEKKIAFNGNPEHTSLYGWCLNEIDSSGAKDGRDLIPFFWSLFFTGSSLKLVSEVSKGKEYNDKDEEISTTIIRNKNAIVGVFHSGLVRDGHFLIKLKDQVRFSMMGTDREIQEFLVCISESSDGNEDCNIYGIPSYDYEVDFRNDTQSDWLQLDITLTSDKFAKIAEVVRAKKVDSATLRISRASGFYSGWSPSISPDYIKVLTSSHTILDRDASQVDLPLVGKVGEFSLTLRTVNNLDVKPDSQKFDFEKTLQEPELDSEYLENVIKQSELLKDDSHNRAVTADTEATHLLVKQVVGKLKIPLWLIFGALVLILLTT